MQAEIVSIGTELLLGEIVDTNSAWIAQQLTTIGLNLYYTVTVGDNLQRIADVLRSCLRRSDIVITTGGLGPTVDDVTREAVAAATDRELALHEGLLQEIACFFAQRDHQMTDNNRNQAFLPEGSRVIRNPVGTAPAFSVEHNRHLIICLPGVPHEMRYLMEHDVLPYLSERYGLHGVIKTRILHTCGIGESTIDSKIGDLMRLANPTVGTAAHPGQTDVRIVAKSESEGGASALIEPVEKELRARLGEYIFGTDQETISDIVAQLLAARGLSLALADGATDGELARWLSGASKGTATFAGAAILSGKESVHRALGISADFIARRGFPSQAVADEGARAIRRIYGADMGLAVIGPSNSNAAGAGEVYFSLALADGIVRGLPRKGRPGPAGRGWFIHLALDLVRRHLLGLPLP